MTISLDSLNSEKFHRITRTGDLATVLRGLDRCEDVGFPSLKINCVTMGGTNDDELADFARLSLKCRLTVRFIEYMPLGDAALLRSEDRSTRGLIDDSEIGPAGGCGAQDRGTESLISEMEVSNSVPRSSYHH